MGDREDFCKRNESNDNYPHVVWKGKKYFLKEFHYHAPSEHTFDGLFTDMEAQHVHVSTDGEALVVAVNLKVGDESPFMAQFWKSFPLDTEKRVPASKTPGWMQITPYKPFLPMSKSYYHYMGSFTTPQCTSETIWILLKDTVSLSEQQLSQFRTTISGIPASQNQLLVQAVPPAGVTDAWNIQLGVNNRPVQPTGNRTVYSFVEASQSKAMLLKLLPLIITGIAVGVLALGALVCAFQMKPKKAKKVRAVNLPGKVEPQLDPTGGYFMPPPIFSLSPPGLTLPMPCVTPLNPPNGFQAIATLPPNSYPIAVASQDQVPALIQQSMTAATQPVSQPLATDRLGEPIDLRQVVIVPSSPTIEYRTI